MFSVDCNIAGAWCRTELSIHGVELVQIWAKRLGNDGSHKLVEESRTTPFGWPLVLHHCKELLFTEI